MYDKCRIVYDKCTISVRSVYDQCMISVQFEYDKCSIIANDKGLSIDLNYYVLKKGQKKKRKEKYLFLNNFGPNLY